MAGNYVPINPVYANTASNSIIQSENDLLMWLKTEKEHYGVTGNHISDNPQAVHAIWEASQKYDVDPMVLVTKLQQEAGLLSHATTQHTLDWALGYGALDCPGGGSDCWLTEYQGFENQVSAAAERIDELRTEFENCNNPACKTVSIDGVEYVAQSAADYVGYTYTPHEDAATLFNDTFETREKIYDQIKYKLEHAGATPTGMSWDDIKNMINGGGSPSQQPFQFYDKGDSASEKVYKDLIDKYAKDALNHTPADRRSRNRLNTNAGIHC